MQDDVGRTTTGLLFGAAMRNETAPELARHLHECGYLDGRPSGDWHPFFSFRITVAAMRFFLQLGWTDYRAEVRLANREDDGYTNSICYMGVLMHYLGEPRKNTADLIDALLAHGGFKCSLAGELWPAGMDLRTFAVLERYYAKEELVAWVNQSALYIAKDTEHYAQLWPHLFAHYYLCFNTAQEVALLLCADDRDMDEELLPHTGVISREWLDDAWKQKPGIAAQRKNYFKRCARRSWLCRFAVLLLHNPRGPTYQPAPDLHELDCLLVWRPGRERYYSLRLRQGLYTMLLVVRRQYGSTRWLKPLLPKIVAYATWQPNKEEDEPAPIRPRARLRERPQPPPPQPGIWETCHVQ